MINYYKILDVKQSDTKEVIVKAYKKLMSKYNAERSSDINYLSQYRAIFEGYYVLTDEDLKKRYDTIYTQNDDITFNEFRKNVYIKMKKSKEEMSTGEIILNLIGDVFTNL